MSTTYRTPHRSLKSVRSTKKTPSPPALRQGVHGIDGVVTPLSEPYQGKTVYRVQFTTPDGTDCVNYVDDARPYVVFRTAKGDHVVFHLESPDTEIADTVLDAARRALGKKYAKSRHVELTPDILLLQYCMREVDLAAAQARVAELNRVLQGTCPNLFLQLAPFYVYLQEKREVARYSEKDHVCVGCRFYETLVLSLCRDNTIQCMSSIELNVHPDGDVFISSKTDPKDEGKKYNKLLRSVLMMVAADIPGAIRVESTAKNPISAWLLIQYHHATIVGEAAAELAAAAAAGAGTMTQEIIRQFYAKGGPDAYLQLRMPLDARNAEAAHAEFMITLGHGLVC